MFGKLMKKRAQRIVGVVTNIERHETCDMGGLPLYYSVYTIETSVGEIIQQHDLVSNSYVQSLGLGLGSKVVMNGYYKIKSSEPFVPPVLSSDYALLRKPLPEDPCSKCESKIGCTSCEKLKSYNDAISLYKESNLYDVALQLEDIRKYEAEVSELRSKIYNAYKYIASRGFDVAELQTSGKKEIDLMRAGFYCDNGDIYAWSALVADGDIKVVDNVLLYCRKEAFKFPGKLVLLNGIIAIRPEALLDCHCIKDVVIPKTVRIIGTRAFSGSGLSSIEIPDTVVAIGDDAFSGIGVVKYNGNLVGPWGALIVQKSPT